MDKDLHRHCFQNEDEIRKEKTAYCFGCDTVIPVSMIQEKRDEMIFPATLLCPNCHQDTLLPYSLAKDLSTKEKGHLQALLPSNPAFTGILSDHQKKIQFYYADEYGKADAIVQDYFNNPSMDPKRIQKAQTAAEFLLVHCHTGDPYVQLGTLFYKGTQVPQDYRRAEAYYEKGAKADTYFGLVNLGYIYYYGRTTGTPDYRKALDCYQKAAMLPDSQEVGRISQGQPEKTEAIYKISDIYDKGQGVARDEAYARNLVASLYWDTFRDYEKENQGYLPDILVREAKFHSQGYQAADPYLFLTYAMMARVALTQRYDGKWFGDKDLLDRNAKDIETGRALCRSFLTKDRFAFRHTLDYFVTLTHRENFSLDWVVQTKKGVVFSLNSRRGILAIPELNLGLNATDVVFFIPNAKLKDEDGKSIKALESDSYLDFLSRENHPLALLLDSGKGTTPAIALSDYQGMALIGISAPKQKPVLEFKPNLPKTVLVFDQTEVALKREGSQSKESLATGFADLDEDPKLIKAMKEAKKLSAKWTKKLKNTPLDEESQADRDLFDELCASLRKIQVRLASHAEGRYWLTLLASPKRV